MSLLFYHVPVHAQNLKGAQVHSILGESLIVGAICHFGGISFLGESHSWGNLILGGICHSERSEESPLQSRRRCHSGRSEESPLQSRKRCHASLPCRGAAGARG